MNLLFIDRDIEEVNGYRWYLDNYVPKRLTVREASSTSEAMEILLEEEVDIVIADMSLVTPALKKRIQSKPITVIAMTAQPTFQHAQLAIELQAIQLFTKPVALESLKAALLSVHSQKRTIQTQSSLAQKDLYISLFLDEDTIIDRSSQQFFLIEPADFKQHLDLYRWLSQTFLIEESTLLPLQKRIICIVELDSLEEVKKHCQLLLQEWRRQSDSMLNIAIYDGESARLRHIYEKAMEALHQRFYKGYNQLYFSSEQIEITHFDPLLTPEQQQFWIKALEDQDIRGIKEFFQTLTLPGVYFHQDDVRVHLTSVLAQIRRYMLKYHLQQQARLESQYRNLFHIILECPILYEILQEMILFIQALMQAMQKLRQQTNADLSELAIDCIHHRYAEQDLSLTTIAEQIGITSTYLSALFSKKQGVPLRKYLQQYRLQQAERLLRETNLPVSEVAVLSGFIDPNYFIRLFKQAYHYTPYRYRQIVAEKRNL